MLPSHLKLRASLMASASMLAAANAPAAASQFRSINQALTQRGAAGSAVTANALPGASAARQAATGVANLKTAAARFLSLTQQLAGDTAAAITSTVPDGLAAGGLRPATGYQKVGSANAWQGVSASQPIVQTGSTGAITVTINQTSPHAVLNWQSFNVGRHTRVTFNQSAGGAAAPTWSVLNRVLNPLASPTRILGEITAQGQVLVLNQNGVLFEAGAQVNLHSLVAGAVTITNQQYLANGLYSAGGVASFIAGDGSVSVAAGADILTTLAPSVTTGGGSVILLGANAGNAGSISTPGGQTILAAGRSFLLQQGYNVTQSASGATSGNLYATVLGSEIAATGPGTAVNSGIIQATDGDITMVGQTVRQYGVLLSSTSVNQRGTIHLLGTLTNTSNGNTTVNTGGSITLEPGSVTEILPDSSAATALNSAQAAGDTAVSAYSKQAVILPDEAVALPDRQGLSRVEITTGGTVTFAAGSTTLAPGGQIVTDATGRIFAASGAQLDVSGLTSVTAPITANLLAISTEPFNLSESPLNNSTSGVLNSTTLYVNTQDLTEVAGTAADPTPRYYTAGGLLQVAGELANVGHTASEWSTVAGQIMLYAAQVIAQQGSSFNIAGGTETFTGGQVRQSYVQAADGTIYNVNTAPNDLSYTGVFTGEHFVHARWHVTDTYDNPLLTPQYLYEPGYTIGRDAGSLTLSTPTALFAGTINGGVSQGITQTQAPVAASDPFLLAQGVAPQAGTLALGNFTPNQATATQLAVFPTSVTINAAGSAAEAARLTASRVLPGKYEETAAFSASQLDGLGGLSITVGDPAGARAFAAASITVAAPVVLAPGGQVSLTAPVVTARASITAEAGSITLQTSNAGTSSAHDSVAVGPGVQLSTAGGFTNVLLDPADAAAVAFQNGGDVTLESYGTLALQPGSSIDTSSGAVFAGAFSGGKGGNVTIVADDPTAINPTTLGHVQLGGTIASYGVSGSGTLSITVPSITIGAAAHAGAPTRAVLSPSLFTLGFTDYVIDGFAVPTYTSAASGVTVEKGTRIVADVPVLVEGSRTPSLPSSESGGGGGGGLQLYLPPEYLLDGLNRTVTQRSGASVTLTSGSTPLLKGGGNPAGAAVILDSDASITVDQGQSVTLSSVGQVSVLGTITAHAGTISLLNLANLDDYINADTVSKLSVWVGGHAVLDASAVAETAADLQGLAYGVVPAGGSIILGSAGDFANYGNGGYGNADPAFVFVRPGAVLNASGASAAVAVGNITSSLTSKTDEAKVLDTVQDASAGGTLTFVSGDGIYLDGAFAAAGGAAFAQGGTLRVELDTPQYAVQTATTADPAWTIDPHEIVVSDRTRSTTLPAGLAPGQNSFLNRPDTAGQAALSQQQVTAGGFTNVDLFARDQIAFAGSVSLHAAQSIELVAFGLTETSLHGSVAVTAPYVQLAGAPSVGEISETGYGITPLINRADAPRPGSQRYAPCLAGPGTCAAATLTVSGDLIDLENYVGFGVHAVVTDSSVPFGGASITRTIDSAGFNLVQLDSAGDIRFAANNEGVSGTGVVATNQLVALPEEAAFLATSGDLSLSAADIYPQTGVTGTLVAGQILGAAGEHYKNSTLDISLPAGAAASAPLSAFGSLTLAAATINQGGHLAAPLGDITFDATRVNLLPGSITSVSAAGLDIPFGGTTDGVSYSYAGQALTFQSAGYGGVPSDAVLSPNSNHGIVFNAASVDGEHGSLLDLSGGGTLAGGGGGEIVSGGALLSQGFIAGSGGSTDVLYSTIIAFNPAARSYAQAMAATNTTSGTAIFAILPGLAATYAPGTLLDAQADYAGSVPQAGEQISLGATVPGLAAGTYTLLPSYYALLPGAYRVQLAQGTTTATAPRTESFDGISTATTATLGFANTAVRSALPTAVIVTSGAAVQRYSQYDQEGLAAVATSQAAVFDTPRPDLPQDAGTIEFQFSLPAAAAKNVAPPALTALTFDGTADLQAAPGGYGGLVAVETAGSGGTIDITSTGRPVAGDVSLSAQSLDALGAPLLEVGGFFRAAPNNVSVEYSEAIAQNVIVARNATLTAGAAWLFATGQISVDSGASISTLGRSVSLPDSSTGLVFVGGTEGAAGTLGSAQAIAELGVANGSYVFSPASAAGGVGNVTIGNAALYSDGFVGISGGDSVSIASGARLGAASFAISVPEINLGTPGAGTRSAGGFTLTQATLDTLLAGDPSAGAPAAASLSLTATDSLNLFGAVSLDGNGSSPDAGIALLLDTPAIYGYGRAGQTATIAAPSFTWSGTAGEAGPVLASGTGSGTLRITAQQITLGQPADSQLADTLLSRTIVGFAAVDFAASDFITANGRSSLSVYRTAGAFLPDGTATGTGGALTLTTPLLTTAPGSTLSLAAGGAVTVDAPAAPGTQAAATSGVGGEIDVTASAITLASAVALPGGALSLDATGDIALVAGSSIDLGGRAIGFFDITQDSFGGTLTAQSTRGDISQAAGALIDLAAAGNSAGSADFTAKKGTVSLAGTIRGSADAGFASGSIAVKAASIANLTALNQALDSGGVFQSRSFEQTGAGDLTVGSELAAHRISVSADQGSLTVTGTLNASGAAPGTISLAAARGLTVEPGAVLDAHGTVLQTDSTGAAIDAENTGKVNLTVSAGTLTIGAGAGFDLASPDGQARGDIEINVARTTATSGDAEISAAGPVGISGAGTIAVNAFWTYTPDSSTALAGGIISQAALAAFDQDSQSFIANALAGGLVHGQLAGLSAYGPAFHLRPGVQIESSANANGGTLTVQGDLDLSGFRYTSANPGRQLTATPGSGEPGVLWIRAAGNLDVFGSISDGFAPPPATPDDDGWVLKSGTADTFQNLVLTQKVKLAGSSGPNGATTYPVGDYTLAYPVTIANGATLAAGARLPAAAVLTNQVKVQSAFVLNGQLTLAGGATLRAGQTVAAGTVLPAGTLVAAGTVLPVNVRIGGMDGAAGYLVPAGVNFDVFADARESLAANLTLKAGSVIPAGASIQFTVAGETSVATRPTETVDGNPVQGQIWGVAPLLPAGDLSWSLALVSGADLASADSLAVLPQTVSAASPRGNLVLSDPHYAGQDAGGTASVGNNVDFSVLRTGTGSLSLVSGGDITEASLFGVYTAGTQSRGVSAVYAQPRPTIDGTVLGAAGDLVGPNGATYNAAVQSYQAYYPTGGGDLTLQAHGDIIGDTYQPSSGGFATLQGGRVSLESSATSSWLWWQGSAATPSAWWINFGTYLQGGTPAVVYLTGFTGFGTLGGGNVTVSAGGNAGAVTTSTDTQVTQGLDVVVASTGRVQPDGATLLTGGGTADISAAAINPAAPGGASDDFNGTFSDLRGAISVRAGSIGEVTQFYGTPSGGLDPRLVSPFVSETFASDGGPVLVLGDAAAGLASRGSAVLSGVGNPTLGVQDQLAQSATATTTQFSLWQDTTAVSLQALSGTIVPVSSNPAAVNETPPGEVSQSDTARTTLYPPILNVTNFTGDVNLELLGRGNVAGLELAPAPDGSLQVLAGNSIINSVTPQNSAGLDFVQAVIDVSGAADAVGDIPTPATPSNSGGGFFSFETDTANGLLHQGDTVPARFYAVSGDILGLLTGQTYTDSSLATAYIASTAVDIRAGQDVVGLTALTLNNNASDISTIQAGRDVVYVTEQVAGPGALLVQAGRNVYQADRGSLVSLGETGAALTQATRDDGAAITVLAGVGADGPNLDGFANLYLNAANLANPTTPLQSQPGRVERTYQDQLLAFLQTRFGYTGTADGALAAFLALPADQQTSFLLGVYFAELNQSGLDYNTPSSRFYHSYLEGKAAIGTLFPATDPTGKSAPNGGSLTLFSGTAGDGSIRTLFGGGITTVVPFGQTSLGNFGFVPGPSAGVITEGGGAIDMYSYGSVSLGQSRILTTFGGNILIWLASDGEINAGRGSKSTVLSAPIGIGYDDYANVTLSPTVPSSGAGIGTISPIPQVAPGDVNLIAPVGTIDAGEAGIRASGNANLAALTLVNANNIQVTGKTAGVPTVTAPSAAAQAAASSSAGASAVASQQVASRSPVEEPSVIEVDVLSVTDVGGDDADERRRRAKAK